MASLSREKTFPAWKRDSSFRRAQTCVTMLNVYGILTDREAAVARQRIIKWAGENPPEATAEAQPSRAAGGRRRS